MLGPIESALDSASRGYREPGNCGETLLMLGSAICLPRAPRLPVVPPPLRVRAISGFGSRMPVVCYPAILCWAGGLCDTASKRRTSLRLLRTSSSSLRKSARRSRLFFLDAMAASATIFCQDLSGLVSWSSNVALRNLKTRKRMACP